MVSATGVARWEYRDRYLDGVASGWVSEAEALGSFPLRCSWTRLTRCGTCAIRAASGAAPQPETRGARRHPALSRKKALRRFPIGTKVIKPVKSGKGRAGRSGQVYGFYSPYWRVCFADNDWEDLTASEMRRFGV